MTYDVITIHKLPGNPMGYQAHTPYKEHLGYYGLARATPQEAFADLLDKTKDL